MLKNLFLVLIALQAKFYSARYGFETALVIAGKVVNQDGSLGEVFMTEYAQDV